MKKKYSNRSSITILLLVTSYISYGQCGCDSLKVEFYESGFRESFEGVMFDAVKGLRFARWDYERDWLFRSRRKYHEDSVGLEKIKTIDVVRLIGMIENYNCFKDMRDFHSIDKWGGPTVLRIYCSQSGWIQILDYDSSSYDHSRQQDRFRYAELIFHLQQMIPKEYSDYRSQNFPY